MRHRHRPRVLEQRKSLVRSTQHLPYQRSSCFISLYQDCLDRGARYRHQDSLVDLRQHKTQSRNLGKSNLDDLHHQSRFLHLHRFSTASTFHYRHRTIFGRLNGSDFLPLSPQPNTTPSRKRQRSTLTLLPLNTRGKFDSTS